MEAAPQGAFPFTYRAFLSYSHHDAAEARRLHAALERYRVPRGIVGTIGIDGVIAPTLFPVFRDRDDLSAASSLTDTLRQALEASAHLVVLCSPASARSRYVEEEILAYKRLGRDDRVHAIVVDGDPLAAPGDVDHCFPSALLAVLDASGTIRTDLRREPLAADLRPEGDGRQDAVLKVVAGILGVPFNALRQRERVAARRRRRWRQALGGAIACLLAGGSLAAWSALHFREEAVERLMPGVRMIDHFSTLDLTGWQPTSAADIAGHVKRSLGVASDSYSLVKTQTSATQYVHVIGTTSDIAPDIECRGCTILDRRADGASRTAHEYRLIFDIASVGLEEAVPITYVTRYWNAFQDPSQWWSGVRISDTTETLHFDIVFPAHKHPLATTLRYTYFDIKSHPFPGRPDVTLVYDPADPARVTKLTWRVLFPLTDRSYRVSWDWTS